MSRLTKELAQEIVTRTMQVIHYNVNVMDERGRIIGSGDRSRLYQKHEGALIAIERKGRFEIDEESARKLQGVLPGTNLAIHFQGEVVGVIGITGDPNEVTKYGELVKMTAEMYLEQADLLEKAQWDKRMKEDFLQSVIHADGKDNAMLRLQAERIGFHPDKARVACIMELTGAQDANSLSTLKQVVEILEGRPAIDLIAIRNTRQIVLYKPHLHPREPNTDICEGIRHIRRLLEEKRIAPLRIAVGKAYSGIDGLIASYRSAQDTMRAGQAIFPEQTVYYSEDMPNETVAANVTPSWVVEELKRLWWRFAQEDKSGELQQTLVAYYDENGEQQRIAERLSIHRNTLRYRLQRIHEATGKDPKHFRDLYTLMTARWLSALEERKPESDGVWKEQA
ncbi:sugar diacid recognition domain-containing protein [Paenibacillus lautus]|uniref:sugar diacid recognition domain-containing protein n=1 Tax=Paenibacillus lautus TaxID=1401 RepID=UPI002DBAD2B6|nr:sugar diacid recognition domain-containing protein [Paenibacillus lautus]MEC0308691.1 sugar diacid recognition domain-containing protein [Paenibacillus lautus]